MTQSISRPISLESAGTGSERSLYERIGSEKITQLITAFYARVDNDPVIRPLYGKTLTCAIHALTDFMTTWLGGPPVYDLRGARLRRRHMPFAIDNQARDAWLINMKAAIQDVGIPDPEASLFLAHLEYGAKVLVNTGDRPADLPDPKGDTRLSEQWNRMTEAEQLFDAVSQGDLAMMLSMLPLRLVPHAELMRHALADYLDPTGRLDKRFGRRSKKVNPLTVIECLLANRDLDFNPATGDEPGRFRHLQAMIETFTSVSRLIDADSPLQVGLQSATRDRFIAEFEHHPECVRLRGPRGQTLLHEAASFGDVEFAETLIRHGADSNARETEGHAPLYRAATGEVAHVLLKAGANADAISGPTRGTALHQAARRGYVSVAQALLDHGATIDARDAKQETPLRRAVNCRQIEIVRLLVRHGADPHAADRRGMTVLDVARTSEMREALGGGSNNNVSSRRPL